MRRWWRQKASSSDSQQRLGAIVVELVPFEVEEQQRRLQGRPALGDLLQQRSALGVLGVDGEGERGVGGGATDPIREVLELVHGRREGRRIEVCDLAAIGLGEAVRALLGIVEQLERPLFSAALDQRLEIPAGLGEFGIGRRLRR